MVFESNFRLIGASGLSVWLNPPFATIVARIGGAGQGATGRCSSDETQALALYRERLPAYRRADLTWTRPRTRGRRRSRRGSRC